MRYVVGVAGLLLTGASGPAPERIVPERGGAERNVPERIVPERIGAERIVTGDGIIDATINGRPARFRVDPAAPGVPIITRELAVRTGLKIAGGWGVGVGYSVGGVPVMLRTQVVRLGLGGAGDGMGRGTARAMGKHRVGWTSRPFAAAADGSVGPHGVPEPVVRFRLHAPMAGERTITLRAVRTTGAFGLFANYFATLAEIEVGGAPMLVRLDPYHPRTVANAGAAVRLARLHDGVVSGQAVPTEIVFGVERPVRTLTLRRPLAIGRLAIGTLGVRTGDGGSTASLREASSPAVTADPDEIVVTGRRGRRDPRRDTLSLGGDDLSRCSEIVFDKPAQAIRLTCA